MKPVFTPGNNIAIKVPSHEFEQNVKFYRDILGFSYLEDHAAIGGSVVFQFGDKRLWIDSVECLSQAEIWLEIEADDHQLAQQYLEEAGYRLINGIEELSEGFPGFWVASPSNIVHLVSES